MTQTSKHTAVAGALLCAAAASILCATSCCNCCSANPEAAGFRTEALPAQAWEASEWIAAADAPTIEVKINDTDAIRAADGASWFAAEKANSRAVTKATWMTAGLGVYHLYLNGKEIGEADFLKPGFTHAGKTKISYTYDVTDAFKKAEGASNVLAAQVTPGWWADKIVTPRKYKGMLGRKPGFRSVLQLTYDDGTTELFGTDSLNWKAGVCGPVRHAAIFDGESYDAGLRPGYECPDSLSTPEIFREFQGEIFPTDGAEICLRHDLALKPVLAYVYDGSTGAAEGFFGKVDICRNYPSGKNMTVEPGDTLVIDFGQNAAAVPFFEFKAAEGTVLTCLPSEILNDGNGSKERGMDGPEGSCHRTNLRAWEYAFRVDYRFGPSGKYVDYHPSCTFFGYRYLAITATAPVRIKAISSVPVSSITEEMETGTIETGSELINKLISNTLWGQRSNYLSVPTDCPQRNERLGWTADTQVFAETGSFFADTDKFFHKWMRDMRDSQDANGSFPGVAPTAQYGDNMMRLGWADAGIIVPWTVWKQFADTEIIDENWDAMVRFIDNIEKTKYDHDTNKTGNKDYQWADWLSFEALESHLPETFVKDENGKKHPVPDAVEYWNYLSWCYWISDAEMMADMAAASGRDASRFVKMASDVRTATIERFLNADGSFKTAILNTMQCPALFALRCGLVEGEALEAVKARLRKNFEERNGLLSTGFLGTSILMGTLTDAGMGDIAWDLLFQRENPSWLYSVDNGATTIWERWNSYTIENGMGPAGMNSFNHYAYGAVCAWIWKTCAGIASDTAAPGFKHIIMKPVPDKRLGSLDAEYNSAAGLIRSSWKYEGDKWVWNFTVPEGATATVTLPGETESKDYAPGSYTIAK